ncbi:glutathionylspermidine synthase family protein [Citreicella sp. C3M06]|uniref:glutathionylspermidine synthase family protein n=1 Tax=Citreicella sp. C3M06 TaxID=2841564 RepID=UPI001C09C398|nr:glutathionylspermidine synthase family protein [Citreicella sp. C3M06]
MQKLDLPERPDWRDKAEELGFTFADMHGEPYWEESSAYAFGLAEIEEQIEDPCTELHGMCREAVARVLQSEELLDRLSIPDEHRDYIAQSWHDGAPELYGRFDLAYGGDGPAKLLEYNADTPTSLYETAAFQWQWFEDNQALGVLRADDDQFNGVHEALVARFAEIFPQGENLHFTAAAGAPEDYATVEALAWAAREAGMGAHYTDLQKIAISDEGQFLDDEDRVIGTLFKLYPWEDLLRDDYAEHLATSQCRMIEPPWKAILSNKGILPVLWEMFEGHPNLLPAFFEADLAAGSALIDRALVPMQRHVLKPLFSREGASVTIIENGKTTETAKSSDYDAHPRIAQAYHPLPVFGGFRPVIGAWVVGETCCAIGIREDQSRITQDLSRFKPHFIRD